MNFADKRVLVVAAHPDDEILGCGGTLVRALREGARVNILILGEGPTARKGTSVDGGRGQAQQDQHSLLGALRGLSAEPVELQCAMFPDNRFDTVALLDIVQWIEAWAFEFRPDMVFTQHVGDLNTDHMLTQRAVMTAFRPLPTLRIPDIYAFEVLSSTEYGLQADHVFHPNYYVDISREVEDKLALLACYDSEMRDFPHPRSYEAARILARLRGVQCGCEAAEAFMFLRGVSYR